MLLSTERPKRAVTRCPRQPPGLSRDSPLSHLSLIVFFRGAVSLSSLSSELSGARLRQLYRRPRERFAVDNRNRLQTFRMAPRNHFHLLSCISRYILFPPCAFPPATTNNTSVRRRPRRAATTTKSSAELLSPWRTGHRATFLVSEVAWRLLYDRRTMARATRRRHFLLGRHRDFVEICPPFLPTGILFHFRFLFFYSRFLSLRITWLCMQIRGRKRANMMDRVRVDELSSGTLSFLLFSFTMIWRSISPPFLLSRFSILFANVFNIFHSMHIEFFLSLHLDLCLQCDRKTSTFLERKNFSFQRFSPQDKRQN